MLKGCYLDLIIVIFSQQQNAWGYTLSMQGVGGLAIAGAFGTWIRHLASGSRKDFAVGLHS